MTESANVYHPVLREFPGGVKIVVLMEDMTTQFEFVADVVCHSSTIGIPTVMLELGGKPVAEFQLRHVIGWWVVAERGK